MRKPKQKPPIRAFFGPWGLKTWLDDQKPEGDFCWVAETDKGRYRLVETFRAKTAEGGLMLVHSSIGVYRERAEELGAAA